MSSQMTQHSPEHHANFTLQPGPRWKSFDQFRMQRSTELAKNLPEGQIGRLNVKGTEYIIVRSTTFNRVYGLAQDVSRLMRGLLLVRHAATLLLHINPNDLEGAKVAGELLRDLTYQLPELPTEAAPDRPLAFTEDERAQLDEEDLDFELGPMKSKHPSFAAPD